MAGNEQMETLTLDLRKRRATEINEEDEEGEIKELEREVREMAEKILDSRRTIPDRILEALNSHLEAQRPEISYLSISDSSKEVEETAELSQGAAIQEADPVMYEHLLTFRDKTVNNIAAMAVILKRMNECIARLDRLEQCNVNIPCAFKRKRK